MVSNKDNYKKLSAFFSEEYNSLRGYVHSRITDTTERDAEDIIQDVALRIFSRSEDASPITNIAGFVYNAVKNRIIDIMRTGKKARQENDEIDTLWADFAELFYSNADNFYPSDLKNALKFEIEKLKPQYRDIIIAIDFEGYSYKEIAEQTGISQGTLMSRRHRALAILSKKLEQEKTNM